MKKILTLLIALAMISVSSVAVSANGITIIEPDSHDVTTTLDLTSVGGGDAGTAGPGNSAPIIKCKWEVALDASNDMDADPTKLYTQVDPPMTYEGWTTVGFYIVVTDPNDAAEISADPAHVTIDIWHPINAGADNCDEPGDGSFKDNVLTTLMDTDCAIDDFVAVHTAGLDDIIWYNTNADPDYDYDEVLAELYNGDAFVYYGVYDMYYHQPAGWYKVQALAYDIYGAVSAPFVNYFEYTLGVGIEIDFDTISWGTTHISNKNWFHGNWVFDPSEVNPQEPTVRNIGNWDVEIWLNFGNMGFGESWDGTKYVSDVVFDARIGDVYGDRANNSYEEENEPIDPDVEVQLPIDNSDETCGHDSRDDALLICHTAKISFAVHVLKATDGYATYDGVVTIIPKIPSYTPDPLC